jgi:hypothetical protein
MRSETALRLRSLRWVRGDNILGELIEAMPLQTSARSAIEQRELNPGL